MPVGINHNNMVRSANFLQRQYITQLTEGTINGSVYFEKPTSLDT